MSGGVAIGVPELAVVVFFVVWAAVVVVPAARICGRLGYSQWIGLLAAVPLANVVLLWYVAFAQWPITEAPQRGS
jgi:hypothetical protein